MRILVTGGAGFIGSHLVEGLARDGEDVIALDDLSTGRSENLCGLGVGFELIVGDIRDREVLRKSLSGVDTVLHHAAIASVPRSIEEPFLTGSVNIQGSALILEEARTAGVARVVFASSSAVYGDSASPLAEDSPTVPRSPYGVQKLAVEHLARTFCLSGGPDVVSLRYFNVYGPRQRADSDYAAAIPNFCRRVEEGLAPIVHGDGEQSRDFVHVRDVVEIHRRILSSTEPWGGEVLNVASGIATRIEDLATTICVLGGLEIDLEHAPARAGDIRHSHASVSKLQRLLGWAPTISLGEGLSLLIPSQQPGR